MARNRTRAVAVARVVLAARAYAGSSDASIAWWGNWVDSVRAAGYSLDRLEVITSATVSRFGMTTWRTGSRECVDATRVMLEAQEVSAAELELLYTTAIKTREREHAIGLWAMQRPDHFEGGWAIRGDFDLSLAASLVGPAIEPIAMLCAAFERSHVEGLARLVGNGGPGWEITIALADAPLDRVWQRVTAAYAPALALLDPLQAWLEQPADDAELVVRLMATPAFAIRVAAKTPADVVAALAAAECDETADEQLAAVAGALDARPRAMMLAHDLDGELDLLLEL